MAEAGFLQERRVRPGSAAAVVLIHGAAIAALLMANGDLPMPPGFQRTDVKWITLPPEPPPEPRPRDQARPQEQPTVWTQTPRVNDVPSPTRSPFQPPADPPDLGARAGNDEVRGLPDLPRADPPVMPPRAAPVRIEAQLISGDLQPPYPASEQRLDREGTVVIRVTIGPNGRVVGVQKVRATSDAFYQATERHARARWRFRPATVDGRPVEGSKTLTVRFELD